MAVAMGLLLMRRGLRLGFAWSGLWCDLFLAVPPLARHVVAAPRAGRLVL